MTSLYKMKHTDSKKRTHAIIPDCQVKPGVNTDYLERIGKYLAEKKPDVIVCLGDFADMPSLSSYDKGKKSFEGRRYSQDLLIVKYAMHCLMEPIHLERKRLRDNKKKQWNPELHMLLGNHEERINRVVENTPELEGSLSVSQLAYKFHGWKVYPFLQPVFIDGVGYCHYWPSGQMGRPLATAQQAINKLHMSTVAGHQQGKQVAYGRRADGSTITSIIAGSCYEHDEDYLTPLTNKHWRGIIMLHEVNNGTFDEMFVSLNYLKEKYNA